MLSFDAGRKVLADLDLAGGLGAVAVAGDRHEVQNDGTVHGTEQVGVENDAALENADHCGILVAVVFGKGLGQFLDTGLQLFL